MWCHVASSPETHRLRGQIEHVAQRTCLPEEFGIVSGMLPAPKSPDKGRGEAAFA